MFEMWTFGMWDVGCGMFTGMWDVDLRSALNPYGLNHFNSVFLKVSSFFKNVRIYDLFVDTRF